MKCSQSAMPTRRGVFATPPPYGTEAWAHDYARRASLANPGAAYLIYRLMSGERNWRCSQTGSDPLSGRQPEIPGAVRCICEYWKGAIRIEWRGGLYEPQRRVDLVWEAEAKTLAEARRARRRAKATAKAMTKVEAAARQMADRKPALTGQFIVPAAPAASETVQ